MDKKEELLKVLDMLEDEQLMWLKKHREEYGIDNHPSSYPLKGFPRAARFFLADLAFRLRDEAVKKDLVGYPTGYMECQRVVWIHVINPAQYDDIPSGKGSGGWWMYCAKPIHWIIAALIAKEQLNKNA